MDVSATMEAYIWRVTQGIPFLSYNHETTAFDVADCISDPTWEQVRLLYTAVGRLRKRRPTKPGFYGVRLEDMVTGYYDRCLEHYCFERLNLRVPHEQTCWVRYAEQTYCLGKVAPDLPLDDTARVQLLDDLAQTQASSYVAMSIYRAHRRNRALSRTLARDERGWLLLRAPIAIYPLDQRVRLIQSAKDSVKKILRHPRNDRVLGVVRSIQASGWDNDLAWSLPEGGAVLGYSRSARRYFAMTGRHRIAAARYLYAQGELPGETLLEFPVISYPWDSWMQGRPHPDTPLCEWCVHQGAT